ncbi:Cyclin A [Carpediemonas membranifera]|uniref:Cyclin A n=1 Tax=Carpediemonas membranifera TaxID=201153 RepID=A0A8J6DY27_9EUKA|nr:Cyclin A [Carpediemonas membranifera]|eukprot:KAG9391419.1 Cyclin A [Carpediemonas membranifera]
MYQQSLASHFVRQKTHVQDQSKKASSSARTAPTLTGTDASQSVQVSPLASQAQQLDRIFPSQAFGEMLVSGPGFDAAVRDVDSCETDRRFCPEYVKRIMDYLHRLEVTTQPTANYIAKQPQLQPQMISIVADWLLEVATECTMQTETYFLGMNILHRYLAVKQIARSRVQLVGTTALWIAAKYEECTPPPVDDFAYMTEDTYTCDQIRAMEREILNTLDFTLTVATARTFLKRYCYAAGCSNKTALTSGFLIELAQRDVGMLKYSNSLIAAAAVALARHATGCGFWDGTLAQITGHGMRELVAPVREMEKAWAEVRSTEKSAAYSKYSRMRLHRVSLGVPPSLDFLDAYK